jgi:hypothetical protein
VVSETRSGFDSVVLRWFPKGSPPVESSVLRRLAVKTVKAHKIKYWYQKQLPPMNSFKIEVAGISASESIERK